MIIIVTALIIMLCLLGVAVAYLLAAGHGKAENWRATEEGLSKQRPYSHVEEGPDSLCPLSRGSGENK
jgi:hypothetical protein